MHIISRKALKDFWGQHPKSRGPLLRWFKVMHRTRFTGFAQLRQAFPSVDRVGDLFVFNVSGNDYRLIAAIHLNRGKVYVRHVLTHHEYDKGGWTR